MHTINQLQLSQYKNFTPKHKYNRIKFQNSEFLFSSIFVFILLFKDMMMLSSQTLRKAKATQILNFMEYPQVFLTDSY